MIAALEQMLVPDAITILFQAIYDFTAAVPAMFAVEALSRGPSGTHFENAAVLFDYVRLRGEEVRMDRHCATAALERAAKLTDRSITSINVHATTLVRDAEFPEFFIHAAREAGIAANTLILEIVEKAEASNYERLRLSLRRLRDAGVRIALDDLGLGNCNHQLFLEVRPDFVKIDRYFVSNCDVDRDRRSLIRSMAQLARDFNAVVIAEGIETAGELATVRALGIDLVQGFLFGRPQLQPVPCHGAWETNAMTSMNRSTAQSR